MHSVYLKKITENFNASTCYCSLLFTVTLSTMVTTLIHRMSGDNKGSGSQTGQRSLRQMEGSWAGDPCWLTLETSSLSSNQLG
jgi:hypothetical protein